MKKTITVEIFSESKKWPRRIPKIKKITHKTIKKCRFTLIINIYLILI